MDAVDEETGEISEDAFAALDQLSQDRKQKLVNVGLAYKSFKAYAEAIKAEEQAMAKRRKQAERKADWLKDYMQASLNGEEFIQIGGDLDASDLSDEAYGEIGHEGHTGTFIGMACQDLTGLQNHADFRYFEYIAK
jgi:beta-xylosidase